ncbi:protein of unknown function [Modestobacter italicus]|uniref:Uncharacterized protein n=1 Tax=Modestobacter italicus (strain DSM 44449 / CECT 9708 / BC 501) TaxID=2732864 RepID=I4EQY0_MODI5|nr:hypothetical protein [Modestobacter marinus]CCH85793.1 protein of unknown function [Modestobacter marinus]
MKKHELDTGNTAMRRGASLLIIPAGLFVAALGLFSGSLSTGLRIFIVALGICFAVAGWWIFVTLSKILAREKTNQGGLVQEGDRDG